MQVLGLFLFKYYLPLLLLLILWVILVSYLQKPIAMTWFFKLLPFVFASGMFAWGFYYPFIAITAPRDNTTVHHGDKVAFSVVMKPAFLAGLFHDVSLQSDIYAAVEAGPDQYPYMVALTIPPNQPAGSIHVRAIAGGDSGSPIAGSDFITLQIAP